MKFQDPFHVQPQMPRSTIIFAGSTVVRSSDIQSSCFVHFNEECFVVADGYMGMPHPEVAARLVSETAIWGYKLVRQRPYYWADKRLLLKRIFRSSNLTVWQKRRETGFSEGLASTLSVVIVSQNKVWVGMVGDSPVYLYREGLIDEVTALDRTSDGTVTNLLGLRRLGLAAHISVENFLAGDCVVIMTSSVSDYVSEDDLRVTLELAGETQESIAHALVHLLGVAQENGSRTSLSACIIKRSKSVSV